MVLLARSRDLLARVRAGRAAGAARPSDHPGFDPQGPPTENQALRSKGSLERGDHAAGLRAPSPGRVRRGLQPRRLRDAREGRCCVEVSTQRSRMSRHSLSASLSQLTAASWNKRTPAVSSQLRPLSPKTPAFESGGTCPGLIETARRTGSQAPGPWSIATNADLNALDDARPGRDESWGRAPNPDRRARTRDLRVIAGHRRLRAFASTAHICGPLLTVERRPPNRQKMIREPSIPLVRAGRTTNPLEYGETTLSIDIETADRGRVAVLQSRQTGPRHYS